MTAQVWGTQEDAFGDEWWDGTTDSGVIITPPDTDSYDPAGVFNAWYAGGSDGRFHYHVAVDVDGAWWVDKFDATMTTLLDRWPVTAITSSTGWELKAPIPGADTTSINEHAATSIGDVLYVTGGVLRNVFGGPITNFAWMYDEASDTWTSLANMPGARRAHSLAANSTTVYAVGGQDGSLTVRNSLFAYTVATNTWSTKATMSTTRYLHAAAWCNGKLYAFGGQDAGGTVLSSGEKYDPGSNTWSAVTAMPDERYSVVAVAVGTDIYVFGGADSTPAVTDTVWKYDTLTDTWDTTLGTAPAAMGPSNGAALLGSLIYLVTVGIDDPVGGNLDKTTLFEYDPSGDSWVTVADPLPVYRADTGAVAATSGYLYQIAGWSGSQTFNTLYRWSSSPAEESFLPVTDIQHVTADSSNVVVIATRLNPVGVHVGYAVTVFDLTGTLLDQWTFDDTASLFTYTGCCLADGNVYFVVRDGASDMKAVDLTTGTLTSLFLFVDVDAAISALDGTWPGTSDTPAGLVSVGTDLIIATHGGIIRVEADGTPVWWQQTPTAEPYRGLAHSGHGTVWVSRQGTDLLADEYDLNGNLLNTVNIPEFAVQAWLLATRRGGWSVGIIRF